MSAEANGKGIPNGPAKSVLSGSTPPADSYVPSSGFWRWVYETRWESSTLSRDTDGVWAKGEPPDLGSGQQVSSILTTPTVFPM